MKSFLDFQFDAGRFKQELDEFGELLATNSELNERTEIQPFFEQRRHLSAFVGSFAPNIVHPNRLAFQFPLFGNFVTDLVIGDSSQRTYCLVEFEDAAGDSIFQSTDRATTEWGRRFEHGYSQIVDWFFTLDCQKDTPDFTRVFDYGHVDFVGLLIIGRSHALSDFDQRRLKWRTNKVLVDSHPIHCLTFDDLYQFLSVRYRAYTLASGRKVKDAS